MHIPLFLHDIDHRAQNLYEAAMWNNPLRYGQAGRGELKARLTQFVRGVVVNEGDLG